MSHNTNEVLDALENLDFTTAKNVMRVFMFDLKSKIEIRSPVDTGAFRADWDIKFTGPRSKTVLSAKIFNRMPYAPPIELGSTPGQKPWPREGSKTVKQAGRIYSSQAPGGVVTPILDDEAVTKLAEQIANVIRL
jgi:hypothetical protein